MTPLELASAALLLLGAAFFLTGTVGLLRFPGCFARLHALTKADNLGLGCVILGVALQAESGWAVAKLALIWVGALVAATVSAHLIARFALRARGGPGRTPP
ncbi:cation:proton antiporter [Halorhodospira neutriphila]|mgnify:CR=1 FL=1|uniref:Na+/H+ antiporter subunit G n=1 Tax=Halorhodospira neutriphila TaxID=168379 RepID=A0ABS1E8B4_9GAMM|nr:monovalent cation/H(+) antiporter subunit G [Halorhodospira neutriphila]MBK1727733.1 Na+/H+ antiporter subunit G [Halorhodospira neutriphila]